MTKEEFAAELNGCFYRDEMTAVQEMEAKRSGLVVCFGASDHLTEFRGCLYDEKGNWGGGKVFFKNGEIANGDHIDDEELNYSELEKLPFVNAVWCPEKDGEVYASWVFETEIPHAEFDVIAPADNELYCKGIVFDFSSIS